MVVLLPAALLGRTGPRSWNGSAGSATADPRGVGDRQGPTPRGHLLGPQRLGQPPALFAVRRDGALVREGLTSCAIFDKVNRTGRIIEVDELAEEVMRRMVAVGVPIVDRIRDAWLVPQAVIPRIGSRPVARRPRAC
jgi:hypothetical protein